MMKAIHLLYVMTAAVVLLAFSAPVIAANMDSRIAASVKDSYVFKTYLQADDIKIQSKGGAVILTGMVLEESHKTLAQETVTGLPGVTSVDNRLEVKGDAPTRNSDAWLTTKVKTTLLYHRSVSGASTKVNVKNGIVTLRGEAASQAQKNLTAEYAKDIEGVRGVNNELVATKTIKNKRSAGEKVDDASITAQVKMALLYHRSTSALNTKVETRYGVVTLHGKAKNASEADLATKFAKDVHGVKSVTNRMTID